MRLSPTHNSLVCPPLLLVKSCKISVNVEEFSSVTRADVTLKNLLQFSSARFARFPRFNELSSSSDFFSFSEELELEHKLESFLSVELLFLLSSDSRLSEFSLLFVLSVSSDSSPKFCFCPFLVSSSASELLVISITYSVIIFVAVLTGKNLTSLSVSVLRSDASGSHC